MPTPIKMPQLGMTMTEAKVVGWLKREGEPVEKGEPVANIETDKLNAEVEASASGILRRIVAGEGAVVPVTGLLGVIAAPDESEAAIDALVGLTPGFATPRVPVDNGTTSEMERGQGGEAVSERQSAAVGATTGAITTEVRASPIAKRMAAELGVDLARVAGSGPGGRVVEADVRAAVASTATMAAPAPAGLITPAPAAGKATATDNGYVRASPIAKRLAREHGLDLRALRGSGPEGRVIERDVLAAASVERARAAAAAAPVPAALGLTVREVIPLEGIRRVIADRMQQSLAQMAQLTLTAEADATALVELRRHLLPAAKVYGHRPPSYTDLLIALVARVLPQHPLLNSSLIEEHGKREIRCWQEINVGVAVALERGLVVPVVRDAGRKPLQQLSQELGELVERARANRLTLDDLEGGTFTITNLGQVEVDAFTPIVNPPQCAILGVGRIVQKPAVYQGQLAVRQMVTLSLSFDHRIVDGFPAGAFLRDVKRAVEAAALGGDE